MSEKTEICELSDGLRHETSNVVKRHWIPPVIMVVKEASESEFGPSGIFDGISFGS